VGVLVGWHVSGGGSMLLAAPNPIAVRPTFPKIFGRSPDESDHCRKCSDCHSYSENVSAVVMANVVASVLETQRPLYVEFVSV